MVHDYAQWTDEPPLIAYLLGGVRKVLTHFINNMDTNSDLVRSPRGWNFYDWTDAQAWDMGVPPQHQPGPGCLLNVHLALTLHKAAELETVFGDQENATLYQQKSDRIFEAVERHFWNAEKGLYADDLNHQYYSQHAQILVLLTKKLSLETACKLYHKTLQLKPGEAAGCTIYFSHYLFEVMADFNDGDGLLDAMQYWLELPRFGFRTTPERPEPSRSDCHAWGAHPLYHLPRGIAGIRPTAFGGKRFQINPSLCRLKGFHAVIPLPQGDLTVRHQAGKLMIDIPPDVECLLNINGKESCLGYGKHQVNFT